jgi:hypothetical protein
MMGLPLQIWTRASIILASHKTALMLVALTSLVAKILCLEGTAAVPTLDWSTLRVLVAEVGKIS